LKGAEKDFQQAKAFGGIYCDDKKLKAAVNRAYCEFSDSNGLFPNVFPALKKFELEVVRMTIAMLHGSNQAQVFHFCFFVFGFFFSLFFMFCSWFWFLIFLFFMCFGIFYTVSRN
jgi:hypothetical protein